MLYYAHNFEISVRSRTGLTELEFVNIYKPLESGLVGFTLQTALPSEDITKEHESDATPGRGASARSQWESSAMLP